MYNVHRGYFMHAFFTVSFSVFLFLLNSFLELVGFLYVLMHLYATTNVFRFNKNGNEKYCFQLFQNVIIYNPWWVCETRFNVKKKPRHSHILLWFQCLHTNGRLFLLNICVTRFVFDWILIVFHTKERNQSQIHKWNREDMMCLVLNKFYRLRH